MAAELRALLDQKHPHYSAMTELWRRYRDFGEGVDGDEDKRQWLPQGTFESDENYKQRLRLTQDLGLCPAALRRIVGALFAEPAQRDYSKLDAKLAAELAAFDANAGGAGISIEDFLEQTTEEAAKLGVAFVFVGREPTPGAMSPADEKLPFCEAYQVEELINWDVDTRDVPLWVVLRRATTRQTSPTTPREGVTIWRVITRERVDTYEAVNPAPAIAGAPVVTPSGSAAEPRLVSSVEHRLGLVPVAQHHGIKLKSFKGRSYVDELSRADLRAFILGSDQAMTAHLHGNPRLLIRSRRKIDEIAADGGRALVLDPDTNETAEYVQLDSGGIEAVAAMQRDVGERGATLAGMDPGTFATQGDPKARSGAAMQWSFSAAEGPTLTKLWKWLVGADLEIHEIATRYLLPAGATPEAHERVFQGSITRPKNWSMMPVADLIDVFTTVRDDVKSPTWRKETAKQIATRAPGNLPPEKVKAILQEIDAADYAAVEPAPPPVPMPHDPAAAMHDAMQTA